MEILYLLLGFTITIVAAAPPGAANIVVMNTVSKRSLQQAMRIVVGAGLGEVVLSMIALHCTMNFSTYFKQNSWIQISVFVLFILAGVFFLLRNRVRLSTPKPAIRSKVFPKFVTGFLLAFLNPPVLIFWVLAFSLANEFALEVTDMSPLLTLSLFFLGVYAGKVATLYVYGKWGKQMEQHDRNRSSKKHLFIGVALLMVGLVQGARFLILP
ncbi:MAG: LysE family transporter [Bacteroidota bacterium]